MSVTGTTRPFAYNPSLSPIPGTTEYGDIAVGDIQTDYSSDYGGLQWWGGPLETESIQNDNLWKWLRRQNKKDLIDYFEHQPYVVNRRQTNAGV